MKKMLYIIMWLLGITMVTSSIYVANHMIIMWLAIALVLVKAIYDELD